jgi:Tfp pilus assembly protein PilF
MEDVKQCGMDEVTVWMAGAGQMGRKGIMRLHSTKRLMGVLAGAAVVVLVCGGVLWIGAGGRTALAASGSDKGSEKGNGRSNESLAEKISIDYPLDGSVFPPEITPPTFLWHDPSQAAKRWVVEVAFANGAGKMRVESAGELMQRGKIDPDAGPGLELTPEQASTHTWKPDAETWAKIKRLSVKGPATVRIMGEADGAGGTPGTGAEVSEGRVAISTSVDQVGAPVFYRDVPLLTTPAGEKGPIQPLPHAAIPLIKWQVRAIGEEQSHVVMEKLHTCANCHSFSRDGKTLGLDLDGPRNDKGLYGLVPVAKQMAITNKDVIRWSSFQVDPATRSNGPTVKRFGFMSQISPDGRYVVTSVGTPDNRNKNGEIIPGMANGLLDRLFSTNYNDFRFLQVFYPTRGILAYYDSVKKTMQPLPGADDPNYVQTSAFWSPDGKYLIFSKAVARDPYPPGAPKPEYANDPKEPQIQYELYKIPFNDGRGGKAVALKGASGNGMSNNFPKVSPDGRWIVFVQNKNGLLMRPDSKLYMVPFEGGKARLMNCNGSPMNSWHTFSPNGRWLAFSTKRRGPYTQLMLTHIDANGNDSPPVIVDNTTAANRAVNIPEFVNIAPDGLAKIDPQAMEFYRLVDDAYDEMQNNQIPESIENLRQALEHDPDDAATHYNLGTMLSSTSKEKEALEEYRKASALDPTNTMFLEHLGVSLILNGDVGGAVKQMKKAIELEPARAEFRFNLGFVLESQGDFAGAVAPLEKAVELNQGKSSRFLSELAKAYDKTGHPAEAVKTAREALDRAKEDHDEKSARDLRTVIAGYEEEAGAGQ